MSIDSADEHVVEDFSATTMDSWAWIGRAREAARRAIEPAEPAEPSPAENSPGAGRRTPPAG